MFEFFLADANVYFNVAIGIVLVLGLLEGLGMLVGLSLIALFDNLSPFDVELKLGLDASADPSADLSTGGLTQIAGWLCLNRLPLMVWLVLFLTCFGIAGYVLNFTLVSLFGIYVTTLISIPASILAGLLLTGKLGKRLATLMPKNESSAVGTATFGGRIATITAGTARKGSPAEASFVDHFKQKHYVMVEPMETSDVFAVGDQVVLVEKGTNAWLATSY